MYTWHKAIRLGHLDENKMHEVTAGEKQICLLRRNDTVYAFPALCPHQSARLCEGWLDPRGHVVCPLHKYHFNPANGYNSSGEGYKLKIYPVEIRGDEVFIGLLT